MYRNGIYIFLFLLGYFVFSHDNVQTELEKWHIPLIVAAIICGIVYTFYYFGDNYSSNEVLQSAFTNLYAWLMMLAILGFGKAYLNKNTRFTIYMAPRSFSIYVLHYPLLILFAYLISTYLEISMLGNYIILLIVDIIAVLLLYEIISRIPIISMLLLGKSVNRKAGGK